MNIERTLKALANRRRILILQLLNKHKELSVSEIASRIKLSFKATSKHMIIMLRAEIVERKQKSLTMYYSLSVTPDPLVCTTLTLL